MVSSQQTSSALKSGKAPDRIKKTRWQKLVDGPGVYIFTVVFFFIVVVIWQLASGKDALVNPIILPEPTTIADAIKFMVTAGWFSAHIITTVWELIAGFIIAIVLGLGLGIVFSLIPTVRRVLQPYIIMFSSIPKVAFIPLFMTWFGFGAPSKIAVAAAIAFFPAFVNTMVGMESTPEDGRRLMYSYGATAWQRFRMLQFPHALPAIMTGINIALTFAIVGVVVGEFQGAREGMGFLIKVFSFQLNIDRAFAVVVLLSIIAYIIYAIIDRVSHRLVFWVHEEQKARGGL